MATQEWISLELINPPKSCYYEQEELTRFAQDCETLGFSLFPLILKEKEGRYEILAGEFQYHAAIKRAYMVLEEHAYSINAFVVRACDSVEIENALNSQISLLSIHSSKYDFDYEDDENVEEES